MPIPAFQEFCHNCQSNWHLGQEVCPAVVRNEERKIIARCSLSMRHGERKHRAMGVRFYEKGPEITMLWWYPEHANYKERAKEFMEVHGN
jgi:hypothetical protein